MASSHQPSPQSHKDELSFGVELEFLFYYKTSEDSDTNPEHDPLFADPTAVSVDTNDEKKFPRPIVLPPDVARNGFARQWAGDLVEEIILSVRGAKLAGRRPPPQFPEDLRSMYVVADDDAAENNGWEVKHDPSVGDNWLTVRGYEAVEFEVISPALWDRPECHRHVHRVVRELARRCRVRVNLTSGFHVHVGAGRAPPRRERVDPLPRPDAADPNAWAKVSDFGDSDASSESEDYVQGQRHSLGVLKRAAALMWAADGFLCHAHPPERGVGYYAPPIRFCSRLARGLEACYAEVGEGHVKKFDKPLDYSGASLRSPDARVTMQEPLPSYSFPRLYGDQRFPVLRPQKLDDEAAKRFEVLGNHREVKELDKVIIKTVLRGVVHILNRKNRGELAELFARPEDSPYFYRLSYNFNKYLSASGGGLGNPETGTLEFREAAGTFDAQWVSVWSSICLGLFRFARDASDTRFWAVIHKLAAAELVAQDKPPSEEKHRYDMISLLFDLGLFAEGLYLESKLRGDPVRFWYPNRLGRYRANGSSDGSADKATKQEQPKNTQSDEFLSVDSSSFVQSPVAGPSMAGQPPSQEPQHPVAKSDSALDGGLKNGQTQQDSVEGNKTSMSWCQSHEDCPLVGK